jgi:hypothetical protein
VMKVMVMTAIPMTFHSVASPGDVTGASATYPIWIEVVEVSEGRPPVVV